MKAARGIGVGIAVAAGFAYGVSLVAARLSYDQGSNYLTIVSLRFSVLCLILYVWMRVRRQPVSMPMPVLRRCLLIGVVTVSTSFAYLASIEYIPVSLSTLLFYTHPLLVVMLAALVAGEHSTIVEVLATVAAFVGLAIVLNVSFATLDSLGLILGVYASVSAAIVFIMSDRVLASVDPVRFTLCAAIVGSLIATGVALAGAEMHWPVSVIGFAWLAVAVLMNVAGLLGMFTSVHLIGPVSTPMILNIEPITAIALALVLLNETMSAVQLGGAAMVMFAVFVAQLSRARRTKQIVRRLDNG